MNSPDRIAGPDPAAIEALDDRLARLTRAVDRALGVRADQEQRDAALIREVGLAKGHLELREDVTAAIEKIQAAEQEKTVATYAKVLSALVHDVIDPDTDIAIDLTVDRGQPALSIWSHIAGAPEFRSSVYENSGGMTNVVCAGLRAIAVAKAGGRRFLMLDEADCWLDIHKVPAFYRVLNNICRDLDFQIVVISHHQPDLLGDVRIVPLVDEGDDIVADEPEDPDLDAPAGKRRGRKAAGPKVPTIRRTAGFGSPRGGASWEGIPASAKRVRSIRIGNLATMRAAELHLDPYLTVVAGPSNLGKSRLTRALRAAFYGEVSDEDIRYGEKRLSVAIDLEDGMTFSFSREHGRNPINLWTLTDADGQTMSYDDQICDTGGRGVPEWVGPMLGIVRPENLDLQVSHGKKTVFLLDETPQRQASVLSVGQEVYWLQQMQANYRKRVKSWGQTVKQGEAELTTLRTALRSTAALPALAETLAPLRAGIAGISDHVATAGRQRAAADRLNETAGRRQQVATVADALAGLPQPPELPADPSGRVQIADRLRHLHIRHAKGTQFVNALADLPAAPEIADPRSRADTAASLRTHADRADAKKRVLGALADLPAAPALPDPGRSDIAAGLRSVQARRDNASRVLQVLENLPAVPDPAADRAGADQRADQALRLRQNRQAAAAARTKAEQNAADLEATIAERTTLIDAAGGECPVCLQPILDAGHDHAARSRARFEQAAEQAAEDAAPAPPRRSAAPAREEDVLSAAADRGYTASFTPSVEAPAARPPIDDPAPEEPCP